MAKAFEVVCDVCEEPFEASSPRATTCSSTCRSRKRRAERSKPSSEPSSLVDAVERDLEAAGRLHTVAGQIALQLARKMSAADATGVSSLSKELRTVLAEALDGVKPPDDEGAGPDDEADPLDEVKGRRERKAREAAARRA